MIRDGLLWVPSKADFTVGPGSPTLTDTRGGVNITHASNGSAYSLQGIYKALPAAPYTLTAKIAFNGATGGQSALGLAGIGLSDGTKYQNFSIGPNNSTPGTTTMFVINYTTATAVSGGVITPPVPWFMQDMWLQIADDNTGSATSRSYRISRDGVNFQTFYQVISNSFLVPTRAHFLIDPYAAATNATLQSWRFT